MKLKHILTPILAALFLIPACTPESDISTFDQLKVSSSYISIPAEGGSVKISLTATAAWSFDELFTVVSEAGDTVYSATPSWLTVSPLSGEAGTYEVTFSADSTDASNTADLYLSCDVVRQNFTVAQLTEAAEPEVVSVAEVVNNGVDGASYRVKGVVSKISSDYYGNWYLVDEDDANVSLYIYGTVDDGNNYPKSGENWNLYDYFNVGDIVTVQGPRTTYGSTIELVSATIIDVVKSLLTVDATDFSVGADGGIVSVKMTYKGEGLTVKPQVDWISISDMNVSSDTTYVSIKVDANEGDVRTGTVLVSSSVSSQTSAATITIEQASGLAAYPLPFDQPILGAGTLAPFSVTNVSNEDGVTVWNYDSSYGAKASAYISKVNYASEVMLVSPLIDLTSATSPVLTFDHAGSYFSDKQYEATVWVSTDNGESWTQLLIPNYPSGWSFVNSGDISLARFVGGQALVAFKYISSSSSAATWELKNVKIEDRTPEFTTIAALNNSATETSVNFTLDAKDVVVTYVNDNNAYLEDATGGILLYSKGHGLTAGTSYSGTITGTIKLYSGFAELYSIDVSKATATTNVEVAPTTLTLANLYNDYLRYQNCFVKLEGVTFETGITTENRNGKISQDGSSIAVYAQVKETLTLAGTGDLLCFPCRYYTTLQLGVWSNDHWTASVAE